MTNPVIRQRVSSIHARYNITLSWHKSDMQVPVAATANRPSSHPRPSNDHSHLGNAYVHEARKKTIGNFTSIYVSRLLRNKILSRCKGQWTAGRADNTNISFSLVMKRTKSVINIDHNLYLIVCETACVARTCT